jgi:DedD protein
MASHQSPDASEIRRRGRQRLIGAVAIALLLIVFVPMLLDSEPRPARQEPKLDIPAKDKAPPLPAPPPGPIEKAPVEQAPVATVTEEPKKVPPKVAMVQPKTEPKAAPPKEGFAVQVGAFADDGHLQEIKGKLALSNITTYTERSGSLTRLRVGPFPTRDAAEKSAADVRKVVPSAKVVPLP